MDLQTIVDISQVVAAITVIGGTAFAVLQLREFRRQRQETVTLDLMRAFMGVEFSEAMAIVTNLPDNLSADDLRQSGPDAEKAATLMCTTFEAIGILVHRRIAPFPLVQDLIGGITVVVWRRLRPWIAQLRVEQANSSDSEWFQWLAEEFGQRKAEKVPAHEQHRNWAP
jgi:hypothetical protein